MDSEGADEIMKHQLLLVWALAVKDWKLFVADKQAAILCFVVPILLASLFGAVFHRSEEQPLPQLTMCLVCEEESPYTKRLVEALAANPQIDFQQLSRDEGMERIRKGEGGAVVILPAGFRAGVDGPPVEIHTQPGREFEGRWAEGMLTEAVMKQTAQDWLRPIRGDAPLAGGDRPFAVTHHCQRKDEPSVHSFSHSFCGMTLQYLLFWGMDSGLLWLRERRRGLWRRMQVAPVPLYVLLAGKVLSTGAIALAQIVVTFAFGVIVFGVQLQGSFIGLVFIAVAAALLSASTGLVIASIGTTEARTRSLSILAILVLSLLGGLWIPSYFLPEWVQTLALATPTAWASRGLSGATWQGQTWQQVLPSAAVVIGFSAVFLLVAWWRLSRQQTLGIARGE